MEDRLKEKDENRHDLTRALINFRFILCFFEEQGFAVFGVKRLTGKDIIKDGGC